MARIIILNGVGSSGKSSIARALQAIVSRPFLHVQMDAFLDMLPEPYTNHPDAFSYERTLADEKPVVLVKTGPLGRRIMRGMRRAIAILADQDINLIVDDVMLSEDSAKYSELLSAHAVSWVAVTTPLEDLEARERRRGDRLIGLALWQYSRVHTHQRYDLEVDTGSATAAECAELIKSTLNL